MDAQVGIIGGGLAGLVSAIDLARRGHSVLLWERYDYPRHKVCGEYISREIIPYLEQLEAFPGAPQPVAINHLWLSTPQGKSLRADLDQGGLGISRYALDHWLAQQARKEGVELLTGCQVDSWERQTEGFKISLRSGLSYRTHALLGAYGKRAKLDKTLNRKHAQTQSPYLGVKRHYQASIPADQVQLHNFDGGYAGISQVEDQRVNFCYLVHRRQVRRYGTIAKLEQELLPRQPHLQKFLSQAQPLMEQPLVISQVHFGSKLPVEEHIPYLGDAAGLIHPFCGNGMAMAMQSAQLAAPLLSGFLQGAISYPDYLQLYRKRWKNHLAGRLHFGRLLSPLLGHATWAPWALGAVKHVPGLWGLMLRQSHGRSLSDHTLSLPTHV